MEKRRMDKHIYLLPEHKPECEKPAEYAFQTFLFSIQFALKGRFHKKKISFVWGEPKHIYYIYLEC